MRHRIIFRRWYRGSHTPSTEHPPTEICYRHTPYNARQNRYTIARGHFAICEYGFQHRKSHGAGHNNLILGTCNPPMNKYQQPRTIKIAKTNVRAGRGCFSLLIHVVNLMTKNSRPTTSVHILDHERTRNIHLVQTSSNTDHPTVQNPWSG